MAGASEFESAVAAGTSEAAEAILRREAAHGGVKPIIALARFLMDRNRFEDAEQVLAPAVTASAPSALFEWLALAQYRRGDLDACEETLERLVVLAPKRMSLTSYRLLAKAKAAAGRHDDARATLARATALHPGATEYVTAYTDLLPPREAAGELQKHLELVRWDPLRAAQILLRLSTYRAAARRAERGLPVYGTSWDDTYRWPDEEALPEIKDALLNELAAGSTRGGAWVDLACVAIAEADWERAEQCFAHLRRESTSHMVGFYAFGRAFHADLEAMSDSDIVRGLPPVERLTSPAFQTEVSLYMGSDPGYFRCFILPFLRQVEGAGIPLDVHVHILDGTHAEWAVIASTLANLDVVRVTLTAEASGAALRGTAYARCYYHAIRYVRAYEELKRTLRPLWVIDADVELLRDPRALLTSIKNFDVALSTRPFEFSPNLKISATCVGFSPTARGLELARRVAAYIATWKQRDAWEWGIDQTALFSSYAYMQDQKRPPSTLFLDETAINDKEGNAGTLLFRSGLDKFLGHGTSSKPPALETHETLETAAAADDADHAEALLRDKAAKSDAPAAIVARATLLMERGRLEDAEAALLPVSDRSPAAAELLSVVQYQRRDFAACEQTLDHLISEAGRWASLAAYQRLAKLKSAAGRQDLARAVMAKGAALNPMATDFVAGYADLLTPDEAARVLEEHLERIGSDPARVSYLLVRITQSRAAGRRAAQGQPPYGTSWPDTYRWPDEEALPKLKQALADEIAAGSRRASAWADLGCVAIAESDWERAEDCFARLRTGPKRSSADFYAFGRDFHRALDTMTDADIVGGLPPIQRLSAPAFQSEVTVFIGCDPVYFMRFALPFIRQLETAKLPLDLHVHLLDGTPESWTEARQALEHLNSLRVTLTAEASNAAAQGPAHARLYYHAVRYIRMFEELARTRRPMWVMDADVTLLRDPRAFLASLNGHDVAVSTRPHEFSPGLKITATCVGLAPTEQGLAFARRVAAYIAHWKERGTWGWGVDQAALFSSYAFMAADGRQPSTLFLDDSAMNDKTGDSGALKFFSGIDKYAGNSPSKA